jgi:hypothetical protein
MPSVGTPEQEIGIAVAHGFEGGGCGQVVSDIRARLRPYINQNSGRMKSVRNSWMSRKFKCNNFFCKRT